MEIAAANTGTPAEPNKPKLATNAWTASHYETASHDITALKEKSALLLMSAYKIRDSKG